jgi:ABC-2 type transport system ATP-binding protein
MNDKRAIEATGLEKSFGTVKVLRSVNLQVAHGTVYGLLGPNGAGKTTIVRILSTLARPDKGEAHVAGFDVLRDRQQVRQRISLTGQYAAVDELLTGEENLRMMGRLSGLSRAQARIQAGELLDQFDLVEAGRRRVGTYSGGMRRRLDLAASLVGRPAVIFLDEPTTGLDPRSRQGMWDIITHLTSTGVTVFLTTQYLDEADQLADRIAVLDGGRIVAEGTPEELKQRVAGQRLDVTLISAEAFENVDRILATRTVQRDASSLTLGIAANGSAAHIRALLDEIDPQRRLVSQFAVRSATLDDVFFALTGHSAEQPQTETANV